MIKGDKGKSRTLSRYEIKGLQKELCGMNVLEEFTDYRISKEYLGLFLERYSKLEGKYGYITGAILTSLFDFIKKKEPAISEQDLVEKSHRLYPIIKGMLVHEGIFKLIKQAKAGKTSKEHMGKRKSH